MNTERGSRDGARPTLAQERYVRIADVEVDPISLAAYRAALKEEIEAAVRVEPGVIALHAAARKDNPAMIVIFEIYADAAAYEAHLKAPHFAKFRAATQGMVKAVKLSDALPIALAAKG